MAIDCNGLGFVFLVHVICCVVVDTCLQTKVFISGGIMVTQVLLMLRSSLSERVSQHSDTHQRGFQRSSWPFST